jgi:ribose-phosphate pyrophosphokinase
MKLICGPNCDPGLVYGLARRLKAEPVSCCVCNKNDQSAEVNIESNLNGEAIVVVDSLPPPLHTNLINLLLIIDAAKRADAGEITVFVPYFGYGRQNRIIPGAAVPAELVGKLITASGADKVCSVDTHGTITEINNLCPARLFAKSLDKYTKETTPDRITVLAPDNGSITRAWQLAGLLNTSFASIAKIRSGNGQIAGSLSQPTLTENCIIVDDIIDSGATMDYACMTAIKAGAKSLILCCTHLLNRASVQTIIDKYPQITQLLTTNTINQPATRNRLTSLDISALLTGNLCKVSIS